MQPTIKQDEIFRLVQQSHEEHQWRTEHNFVYRHYAAFLLGSYGLVITAIAGVVKIIVQQPDFATKINVLNVCFALAFTGIAGVFYTMVAISTNRAISFATAFITVASMALVISGTITLLL